jgi:hypothetical protein
MKNKRYTLVIAVLVLVVFAATMLAANPFKARFRIINQTEDDIYIILQSQRDDGEIYPQLIAFALKPEEVEEKLEELEEDPKELYTTEYTIVRDVYEARVIACGYVAEGTMDLRTNLRLNFTQCEQMPNYTTKKYLGEPTMEKPNWFRAPGMINFRFVYEVPPMKIDEASDFFTDTMD